MAIQCEALKLSKQGNDVQLTRRGSKIRGLIGMRKFMPLVGMNVSVGLNVTL